MKVLVMLGALVVLSACSGNRGTIGGQKVCTNSYLFGTISLAEMVDPCNK